MQSFDTDYPSSNTAEVNLQPLMQKWSVYLSEAGASPSKTKILVIMDKPSTVNPPLIIYIITASTGSIERALLDS